MGDGIDKFLQYIREVFPDSFLSQDLLKVTRRQPPAAVHNAFPAFSNSKLCVVIDGESCLDRLYGGYYSDWCCGGQWNRLREFLPLLSTSAREANIALVVLLDGTFSSDRRADWKHQQLECMDRCKQILTHVKKRQTPPPRALWMAPTGLRTFLRILLKELHVPVFQTVDDHKQEVMTFVRDNNFDVLLSEGAEYLFMEPPRFMFSTTLKLTFKGKLQVEEFQIDDLCHHIDLHPSRLCLVAALLGNFILTQADLKPLHEELLVNAPKDQKNNFRSLVPAVITFVRNLPTIEDYATIGDFIFTKLEEDERREKTQRFIKSVNYYLNATKTFYHKFTHYNSVHSAATGTCEQAFASDTTRTMNESENGEVRSRSLENGMDSLHVDDPAPSGSTNTSNTATKQRSLSPAVEALSDAVTAAQSAAAVCLADTYDKTLNGPPSVPNQIINVAKQRHCNALMHPWIYQILTKAEIGINYGVEEMDGPAAVDIWRGVRQSVYAILFDLNHKSFLLNQHKANKPSTQVLFNGEQNRTATGKFPQELSTRIYVKEWYLLGRRKETLTTSFMTPAVSISWKKVPTVKQLWFRQQNGLKRIKAFLACMLSDTPLMMNTLYVPQKAIILCCVLRYLISYRDCRLLQRHELDAFLCTATSPQLLDAAATQEIAIQNLTGRGLTLARWFMSGVEHAIFANDACGAPIPAPNCSPWLFFDGKLFQLKLAAASRPTSLFDLCRASREQAAQVERMRMAILEGFEWMFLNPSNNSACGARVQDRHRLDTVLKGRTVLGRRSNLEAGGQLEIAGKVVGRWRGQTPSTASGTAGRAILGPVCARPGLALLAPPHALSAPLNPQHQQMLQRVNSSNYFLRSISNQLFALFICLANSSASQCMCVFIYY